MSFPKHERPLLAFWPSYLVFFGPHALPFLANLENSYTYIQTQLNFPTKPSLPLLDDVNHVPLSTSSTGHQIGCVCAMGNGHIVPISQVSQILMSHCIPLSQGPTLCACDPLNFIRRFVGARATPAWLHY